MKIIKCTLAASTVALSLTSPVYATDDDHKDWIIIESLFSSTTGDDDHNKWIEILGHTGTAGDPNHDKWIDILSHTGDDPDDEKWRDLFEPVPGDHDEDGQDILVWQQLLHNADNRLHEWRREFRENRHHRRHDREHHGEHHGVPQVPVPAAVWLFGSGLLGLVGVARRRKSKTI